MLSVDTYLVIYNNSKNSFLLRKTAAKVLIFTETTKCWKEVFILDSLSALYEFQKNLTAICQNCHPLAQGQKFKYFAIIWQMSDGSWDIPSNSLGNIPSSKSYPSKSLGNIPIPISYPSKSLGNISSSKSCPSKSLDNIPIPKSYPSKTLGNILSSKSFPSFLREKISNSNK